MLVSLENAVWVGLFLEILYFPLLGLRGSYLLIFVKSFKSPTWAGIRAYGLKFRAGWRQDKGSPKAKR